jgi:hypothetical protein
MRPALLKPASLLALLVGAVACTSPLDVPGSTVPGQCQQEPPLLSPQRTDILFVIDNSLSMAEEQAAVATELPAFVEELRKGSGVVQDFRIGVITTSVYQLAQTSQDKEQLTYFTEESGRLQPVPDAEGHPTAERFLDDEDPQLMEKFRRLVVRGTLGSGQETPFEAVRLAVTPPLTETPVADGGNGGFLREGARLVVVLVSDEDDCSSTQRPPPVALTPDPSRDLCHENADLLTSVDEYLDLFRQLDDGRGSRREVLWTTLGPVALTDKRAEQVLEQTPEGPVVRNADCPTSFGAGFRLREMAERFYTGLRNLDSICRPSYRDMLVSIASLAASGQSVDVVNLPDPRLAQVRITRADGTVQTCSVVGGGVSYAPSTERHAARLYFQSSCPRRVDDQKIDIQLLCAN